ncbi:MAG: SpoIID/LytB domain-containing protein [Crinalium sp.]
MTLTTTLLRFSNLRYSLIPLLAAPTLLLPAVRTSDSASVPKQNLVSVSPASPSSQISPQPSIKPSSPAITPTAKTPTAKTSTKTQVAAPVHQPTDVELKVAIAINVETLAVGTSTTGIIRDEAGRVLQSLPAGVPFNLQASANQIDFGLWKSPHAVWLEATPGGYVGVGEHWYRGKVKLISRGSTLLAVNYVNLETYLYSVVGSEMPSSWPVDALKAQAVAARSYALVRYLKPANPYYNIGATQAWQVYKGLSGEASSTYTAVELTRGQILTAQGSLVDAWYADTQETSDRAHDGKGMSQHGAKDLAKQGYDYTQILGTYYPGSSLTPIQISATARGDR